MGEFIANESLPSPGYGLSFEYSDLPDDWARDIVKNLKEEFGIADEPKKDDPEP